MPYIKQEDRDELDFEFMLHKQLEVPGELNFLICSLINRYIEDKEHNYTTYNDIFGVLEHIKFEIHTRFVEKYENKKRAANGDVFS